MAPASGRNQPFLQTGVTAVCEAPRLTFTFGRDTFAADPRLSDMRWER